MDLSCYVILFFYSSVISPSHLMNRSICHSDSLSCAFYLFFIFSFCQNYVHKLQNLSICSVAHFITICDGFFLSRSHSFYYRLFHPNERQKKKKLSFKSDVPHHVSFVENFMLFSHNFGKNCFKRMVPH